VKSKGRVWGGTVLLPNGGLGLIPYKIFEIDVSANVILGIFLFVITLQTTLSIEQ